jgi:hypothetical protein
MPRDLRIAVAEWRRSSRETLPVRLDTYNGQVIVDCRSWYRDANGELRPGTSGLTLAVRHLPELADAVSAALAHARNTDLLADEGRPS